MITEEITIKHLDILLENIIDVTLFDINTILSINGDFDCKNLNEEDDFTRVCQSVKRMGETFKYFKSEIDRPKVFGLTRGGIKAKELGGHLKYQNSLKPKTKWLKFLNIIFGGFLVIFGYLNYDLKVNQSDLSKKLDSITKSHDSLNFRNVFLLKLVDSLTIENKLKSEKLKLKIKR